MSIMTDEARTVGVPVLDEQDRIAILQMLELTPSQRVAYLVDEVDFDVAVGAALGDD